MSGAAEQVVADWAWTVAADLLPGSLMFVPGWDRWERCHKVEGVLDDGTQTEWIVVHFYIGPRNVMHWPLEPTAAVQVAADPVGDDGPVQQTLRPVRA